MTNKYYVRRYLNVIDLDGPGTALLFNGVNGCLDEISKELGNHLRSAKGLDGFDFLGESDIRFLKERGHITELDPETEKNRFRELAAAIHKQRAGKSTRGSLMLLMSYNCNLDCQYCYQRMHRPGKSQAIISEELLDSIFTRHLAAMLPGIATKNVDLSFYGGEPFLPSNEKIVRKALSYAAQYGMGASAISNATKIDTMLDIFGPGPGKVSSVQVSLDGDSEKHNASRIPVSGEKTFDKIIDNIRLLLDRGTKVNIRINLDKHTLPSIPALLEDLKARKILGRPNSMVYASPIKNNLGQMEDTTFLDMYELSSRMFKLGVDMEHPVSLRANDLSYLFKLEKGMGLSTTSFCMQTMQQALIVDPFGDLYACFEEAGHTDLRVGRIAQDAVEFFPLSETYKTRHIANMDKCVECSVALSCGGQCGIQCRAKTGSIFKPNCDGIKETVLEAIKFAYQKKHGEQAAKN